MNRWLNQYRSEPTSAPVMLTTAQTWPQTPVTPATPVRPKDPNAPDYRYQLNQKCIYERRLPGGSYITAHVQRLQSGYYDSPVIHEDLIDNVRFVAINFVFHPTSTTFRFKSAEIRIALHHSRDDKFNPLQVVTGGAQRHSHDHGTQTMSSSLMKESNALARSNPKTLPPKFLRHAPHLLYGAISPETLNWNFNLAGSLGVSQGPANAAIKPSYGVKSSYKIFEMMKIQGSVRTLRSWYNHDYDIEDGEMIWTLEENRLEKSGLPREFTFVMLLTKGSGGFDLSGDVKLEVDIRPKVSGRLGTSYPDFITNLHQYQPLHTGVFDLDQEIGQVFEPQIKGRGFNFANIANSFDDFVYLPGTTYSTSDSGVLQSPMSAPTQQQQQPQTPHAQQQNVKSKPTLPSGDTTLNLRVFLESSRGSPVPFTNQTPSYINLKVPDRGPGRTPSPLPPSMGGSSNSTRRTVTISSRRSVRKQRSRSELSKEYSSPLNDSRPHREMSHKSTVVRDRTGSAQPRQYSYHEALHDQHDGFQLSAQQEPQQASQSDPYHDSSPEYKTPPLQASQPVLQAVDDTKFGSRE
ncbi:hypothetical protein LTR47_001686 [Exophiala xenobiotica]|nr:hypothetical protein LTR92_000339 [Exophiala xenobiotica]KAK5224705.1 hypothetical protein LTR72_004486 [Exophiala xenobiotica]KAK5237420.1 hypothetical protein LTR47_001686 [Exophiala xenobiotica]KAK5254661.1 hypothetical protein LTS06_001151 [Exophiala xenobiotica]KAK5284086.1 hypothetical protein LTR40_000850 [Exophiala xenobiotica]